MQSKTSTTTMKQTVCVLAAFTALRGGRSALAKRQVSVRFGRFGHDAHTSTQHINVLLNVEREGEQGALTRQAM
jgi:hypothetical protein